MLGLVSNFSKVGKQILKTCVGNFTTAKGCLQLQELSWFFGRENDSACTQDMLLPPVGVYGRLVLCLDPDIRWSTETVETCKACLNRLHFLPQKIDSWTVPPGPVPVQKSPVHILYFLGNVYRDEKRLENWRHIPLSK